MTRALIFGIAGQDGSYLSDLLVGKGYEVFGFVRHHAAGLALDNIAPETVEAITFLTGDMADEDSIRRTMQLKPDEVYNLAAMSFVATSWSNVDAVMDINALGAMRVFRAVRDMAPAAKVYQASSSEMFGRDTAPPQAEHSLMRPISPYGVSKLTAHHMANVHRLSYGTFISCGICFNHESERRGPHFVSRKIARGVALIAAGLTDTLTLGDMTARRDWGYAPDYVDAMWLMLQQDVPDDFVIASGRSHSVAEFAMSAFRHVGITDWKPYLREDPDLRRPVEIPRLLGATTKARRVLGWQPTVEFDDMVARMVDAEQEALNG